MIATDYQRLYTDGKGRPTAKWLIIAAAFVIYALSCVVAVFSLPRWSLGEEVESTGESPRATNEVLVPDFASFQVVEERKAAFFDFLIPLVQQQNREVLNTRNRILQIQREFHSRGKLNRGSRNDLAQIMRDYRLEDESLSIDQQIMELLRRVDQIPVSMVLAQAATESAWGTSRFATQGNNFFGQWCFSKGCGFVPLQRDAGALHEVAAFETPRDSVRSYFRNINTHRAYRRLRSLREDLRSAGRDLSGLQLIQGLGNYSERGQDYVRVLRQIIRGNKLAALDFPNGGELTLN